LEEKGASILNRPPFNIVSMPQRDQLRLVFETLDEDDRVRVIVVRAVGEHFSSGGNIGGFLEATPETVSKLAWNIASPARCSKPVIVANRGYCFGVGFELSLACDFRIASDTAQFALPEQKLGQIPGSGGSARLQKVIGITRTKDIVMRSKRIPARQALEWGIVTECVADKDLEATTDKLVDELRSFSPIAQRTAKKLLNDTEDSRHWQLQSRSRVIATAGYASRKISRKASRPSTPSGRRSSSAADRSDVYPTPHTGIFQTITLARSRQRPCCDHAD
jgi:2-oxoglutaroyl-CoA hydrolase